MDTQSSTMDGPSTPSGLPEDLSALRVSTKCNTDSKLEISAKTTTSDAAPSTANKATFLTRKAHRFSTLKKKKNATTILNRLFYNSPPAVAERSNSKEADQEDGILEDMTGSSEENRSPQQESCSTDLSRALESANDKLTLHAEEEVRDTIRSSFRDAGDQIMHVCGSNTAASPPTVPGGCFRHGIDEEDPPASLVPGSNRDASFVQSPVSSMVKSMQLRLSTPSKEEVQTPQPKVMQSPGGISIPTPFTNGRSGSLFPSTMFSSTKEQATKEPKRYSLSSGSKELYGDLSQSSSETLDNGSIGLTSLITQCVGSPAMAPSARKNDSVVLVRMVPSNDDLSTVAEATASKETATYDEDDADDEAFLPDDFKAVVGSGSLPSPDKVYTLSEMEAHIAAAVEKARSECVQHLLREQESKLQEVVSECKSEAESLLEEHGSQWKQEHKHELELIRSKYERKINEHKDQVSLANRLVKSKQAELDRLEGAMQAQYQAECKLSDLQRELVAVQMAKDKALADLEEKLAAQETAVLDGFRAAEEAEAVANARLKEDLEKAVADKQRIASELDTVKAELNEKAHLQAELDLVKSESTEKARLESELESELASKAQLLSELEQVRAELVEKTQLGSELEEVKAELTAKSQLESEFEQVKAQLATKSQLESELEQAKAQLVTKVQLESELEQAKAQLASKSLLESELEQAKAQLTSKSQLESELEQLKTELTSKSQLESELKQAKAQLTSKSQLESELEQAKAQLTSKSQLESELEQLQAQLSVKEKETQEVSRLRNELADAQAKLETHEKDLSTVESFEPELERLTKELLSAQSLLDQQEKALQAVREVEPEFQRVQSELEIVQARLSAKEKQLEKKVDPAEVECLKKELNDVKIQLQSKEKELLARKPTPTRVASPSRRSTPSRLRTPSPSVIRATPARSSCSRRGCSAHSEEREVAGDFHEQEKENLRKQIILLEEEAAKSKDSHLRALQELQAASDQEIARVKRETLSTVASMEKDTLLDQIENLQVDKQSDRSGFLREVQKKEDLLRKINVLEKRERELTEAHERSMQELRAKTDNEMERLRKEMKKNEEERWNRERELSQAMSQTKSFEKEDLLEKIEKLQGQLEQERNGAVLVKMKVAATEKEAKATETEQKESIAELQSKLDSETKRYQQASDSLKIVQRSSDSVCRERDSLKEQVSKLQIELETISREYETKIEDLRKSTAEEIDSLRREAVSRLEYTQKESKLRVEAAQKAGFDLHSEQTKELEERIASLESQLHRREMQLKEEREAAASNAAVSEKKLREELRALQELVKTKESQYHAGIKQVEEKHGKELDELLAQLDLVEAEHKEKLSEEEKTTGEKDAIIKALGAQLAEAHAQTQAVVDGQKDLNEELENARAEVKKCITDLETSKAEVLTLKKTHKASMEQFEEEKRAACQEAREEMIERAEAQFKQANELYVKLKKQYDASRSTIDQLQTQLKAAESKLMNMQKEKDGSEIDLKAEIAQLKANYAKIEADAAQKAKEYRKEMGGLLDAAKDFESKADQAEANSRSLQKKVTTITKEKAVLQKECDELRSVCEELMAIVEGGPRHEC